jgi:hypothetical protein
VEKCRAGFLYRELRSALEELSGTRADYFHTEFAAFTAGTDNINPNWLIDSTMKMEATFSSETAVLTRPTLRHIPEDAILKSHFGENPKSYTEYGDIFQNVGFSLYSCLCHAADTPGAYDL